MKYRKLIDNDYSFGEGAKDFLVDADAIAQAIKTKILLFYGEWWEDVSIGIPIFETILGQVNEQLIEVSASLLLEKRILELKEVSTVDKIEVSTQSRTISFVVQVTVSSGESLEVEVNI